MHVFDMFEQMILQYMFDVVILVDFDTRSKSKLPFFEMTMTLDTFEDRFTASFSRGIPVNETE
jgi:hypothetical protein